MEYIKSWLKTILYMNVLLLICDNLMQKQHMKNIIVFSGFLLVVCLLNLSLILQEQSSISRYLFCRKNGRMNEIY